MPWPFNINIPIGTGKLIFLCPNFTPFFVIYDLLSSTDGQIVNEPPGTRVGQNDRQTPQFAQGNRQPLPDDSPFFDIQLQEFFGSFLASPDQHNPDPPQPENQEYNPQNIIMDGSNLQENDLLADIGNPNFNLSDFIDIHNIDYVTDSTCSIDDLSEKLQKAKISDKVTNPVNRSRQPAKKSSMSNPNIPVSLN